MPTIEFYGFDAEQCSAIEATLRDALKAESFAKDCVFVDAPGTKVRGWDGDNRPFVRVSTRSEQRAEWFKATMADVCDLETVIIGFQPVAALAPEQPV